MSYVSKRYFIAEGERAKQVAKAGLDLVNAARKKRADYLDEVGADGLWERRNQAPFGIVFYKETGQLPGFLKPEKQSDDGKVFWIHRTDKRTTLGKTALQALSGLASFDFSDYACRELGVSHSTIGPHRASRSGLAMYSSVAGVINGVLVCSIPFGGDSGGGGRGDIEIPADLREIKYSEYIAMTEEVGAGETAEAQS